MSVEQVHIVTARRAGKPIRHYIYAWRGGPQIRVAEQPDKPKLTRADVAAIAAAHDSQAAPTDTLKGLSAQWIRSRQWKGFAKATRDAWSPILIRIERKWGDVPLRLFGDPRMTPKLVKWRDDLAEKVERVGRSDAGGPRAADETIKVLAMLLDYGVLAGRITTNTARPVPRLWKGGNREEIIWLPEDCAAFDAVAPRWVADARRLAEFTGLRRADLVALTWAEISETHIARTAEKKTRGRRRRTIMPIVPGLRELLDELRTRHRQPDVETVLVATQGRAVAKGTLTTEFNKARKKANGGRDIVQPAQFDDEEDRPKHLHDLRGTFATKLMTLPGGSLTDAQIALVMGWTEQQVAAIRRRYVDEAAIVVAIGKRIAENL